MASEGTAQLNLRVGDLAGPLGERADGQPLSQIARRDLGRYYHTLDRALPHFAEGEASLIVDALNGTITEPHTAALLWASVADSLRDSLATKWGVDGPALVRRLRALTAFESLAVADAVERAWIRLGRGEDLAATLRAVGLVR